MYLFRGGDGLDMSPEEMEVHMAKWKAWMGELAQNEKLVGGLPLSAEGKQVTDKGTLITDGPYAEGKEIVGGYIIVNAADMDEAVEISKGCPIFEGADANVEVRELMAM